MSPHPPAPILRRLRRLAQSGELAPACERLGVNLLVAFGSALRAEPSPRDLDLAVKVAEGRQLAHVAGEMIGWLGTDALDVIDLRAADVVTRYEALAKGELLYERLPGDFAEAQIAAVLRFADTQWLRDLQLQALAR